MKVNGNKLIIKICGIGVMLIMIFLTAACGNANGNEPLPYNARFSSVSLKDDFRIKNVIKGMIVGLDDKSQLVFADESYPATRTFIVRRQDEYEQICIQSITIDFEKEMLLIYTFAYPDNSKFTIRDVSINGETLYVYLSFEISKAKSGYGNMTAPKQKWIGILMDKLDIESAEFK